MKRLLTPSLNPAGLTAAANLACAVTMAILARYHVHWGLSVSGLALVNAGVAWWNRTQVTPIADPRVPGKIITDLAASSLPPDPTMTELAAWLRDRGVEARFEAQPLAPPGSEYIRPQDSPPVVPDQPQPPGA